MAKRHTAKLVVAECSRDLVHGQFGVLLGLVEMQIAERKVVGGIVPGPRVPRKLDGAVERLDRFLRLAEIRIGSSETYLITIKVRMQRDRRFQFLDRLFVLTQLNQHEAEVAVRRLVQW